MLKPIRNFGPQPEHPSLRENRYPQLYECTICGHYHPVKWDGDCRDDNNRFTMDQLDARFGASGWVEVPMPGTEDVGEEP